MIKNLEVRNFKSLKHLKLDCQKINIFIGKPNTGKSNILESIGIFSFPYLSSGAEFRSIIRLENSINLFYDQDLSEKIEVISDSVNCEIIFDRDIFSGEGLLRRNQQSFPFSFRLNYPGDNIGYSPPASLMPFKFYRFGVIETFPRGESNFLIPPRGTNLLSILLTNKDLRKMVLDIFSEYGLRLVLKPIERKMEVQKEREGVIVSYPYSVVSDTLQRIIFHLVAIESNKDSVIIFEEPEVHAFPYYTKFLAERIALDKTNQYFISTHNPYFLLPILEKAPKDDVGIFVTYFEDYQTKVKLLSKREMEEILALDASAFFNLDQFLEKE